MDIKLFNGLHDRLETFKPIQPGKVTMYVCGPTVYDYVHIGNLRPLVVFDVLKKLFIALGYQVHHVSNYTDIDDRIIEKAQKEKVDEVTIAKRYIQAYQEDVAKMNALLPDQTPTVTEHLQAMITFIGKLIKDGFAYKTPSGDVFFRVNKVKNYGQLSHVDIHENKIGARVEVNPDKENPFDFVLWKHTTQGIKFSAPFGEGRPGWHTECVVMIKETFKQTLIDIHGGGFDLKFPHHENEMAQAQAAYQSRLANYWLHNGFINLNAEKMSKSTGNIFLAKDFLSTYSGPLLRYVLLATHYRMPVNISPLIIDNAQQELKKIQIGVAQIASYIQLQGASINNQKATPPESFLATLADDINTSNALTIIHQYLKEANGLLRQSHPPLDMLLNRFFTIQAMLSILGLAIEFPILTTEDHQLYKDYLQAKSNQNFGRSDEIRKILHQRNILF
ncbi:MAG: cysteine--tRNA ligase [Bacillota bacterium]